MWILAVRDCGETVLSGEFSTKEKAEEYITESKAVYKDYHYDLREAQPDVLLNMKARQVWSYQINSDGSVYWSSTEISLNDGTDESGVYEGGTAKGRAWATSHKSRDHAKQLAQEAWDKYHKGE